LFRLLNVELLPGDLKISSYGFVIFLGIYAVGIPELIIDLKYFGS